MKRIVIFLASSIEDLKEDRVLLGDYFQGLSQLYSGSGIEFELVKCEYCDDSLTMIGKQHEYDEKIRESDLCFFLFFRRVGKYTRHEFDVAWESFQARNRPQIVTYFKNLHEGECVEDSVASFISMLQDNLGHYPGRYDHVDTVKLSMLMKINRLTMHSADITIKNGDICFRGEVVAQSKNIPLLHGNTALRELMDEKQTCEREVVTARTTRDNDPSEENDDLLYEARRKLARVSKELTEIEREMLGFASTVEEMTSDGRVLTRRMKEALGFYEAGNYQRAKQYLESKERENELERACLRITSGRDDVKGYVEEMILWIQAEMAGGITRSGAQKIEDRYDTVVRLIDDYNLSPDPLYDYATFLMKQNHREKAIEMAQKLLWYYSKPGGRVEEARKARLLDLLGTLYHETNRPDEAERMHLEALTIWKGLSARDAQAYEMDLALCYNSIGELYHDLKRYETAETWYCLAQDIWKRLAENATETYLVHLAGNYNNLGLLCMNLSRIDAAEKHFKSAIEIREGLVAVNPDAYEPDLAKVYNNLGLLYAKAKRYDAAEEMYQTALRIRQRLALKNPDAYQPNVANIYYNLGNLYLNVNSLDEAERMYRSALEIRMRLAGRSDTYLPELASSYRGLGEVLEQREDYLQAEAAYRTSGEIFDSLAQKNPSSYEPSLASVLYNMGRLYRKQSRNNDAAEVLRRAENLYCRCEERNPGHYSREMNALKRELVLLNGG